MDKVLLLLGSLPMIYTRHEDVKHVVVGKERQKSQRLFEFLVSCYGKKMVSHSGETWDKNLNRKRN